MRYFLTLSTVFIFAACIAGCGSNAADTAPATPPESASNPPPQLPAGSTPQNESGAANPEASGG